MNFNTQMKNWGGIIKFFVKYSPVEDKTKIKCKKEWLKFKKFISKYKQHWNKYKNDIETKFLAIVDNFNKM